MPSLSHAFLALLLIVFWSGCEVFDFDATNHWAPLFVAIGILPIAWRARSKVLLCFTLDMFQAVFVMTVLGVDEELSIPTSFFLSVLYIIVGLLVVDTKFPESHRVFKCAGFFGYFIFLYLFSFPDGAGVLADIENTDKIAVGYLSLLLVAGGCFGWLYLGRVMAIPMNFIFLAHCVLFIGQGAHEANAKLVSIACLLFSVLVVTRYVDLFESLLVRSLIFLVLGAGLFLVGTFYSRLRRRDTQVYT